MKLLHSSLVTAAAVVFWLLSTQLGNCYYSPSTGRWLTRDPIAEHGGANLYSAIANSPVDRIDPDGRLTIENCPPKASVVIQAAFQEACRRIKSTSFGCCMVSSRLGRDYASELLYLCGRDFKVRCTLQHEAATGGVAVGRAQTQTVLVYNGFFTSDAAGWGHHACVLGHEMVHLLGPEHPRSDRLFNRIHECLGCAKYRNF